MKVPASRLARCAGTVVVLCSTLLLNGCAGYQAYHDGQAELARGHVEAGLSKLRQALSESPENVQYRASYFSNRDSAMYEVLQRAEALISQGNFVAARAAYAEALRLDPNNARAADGANRVAVAERTTASIEAAKSLARAGHLDDAITQTRAILSEDSTNTRAASLLKSLMRQQAAESGEMLGIYPQLRATYRTPVSLSFSNATLHQVFDALKQASGLNYVFDKEVHADARVTLSMTNKPVQDVLRLLLATNQLAQRVLDDNTLLIYPDTPAKAAEYREMVIRNFYLTNVDASKMAEMAKTIAKAKDVMVDDKLNLMVVRDNPQVIRLVEKLVEAQDLPDPEVMLDLEVLEVSVDRLTQLGLSWPSSVSASVQGAAGVTGQLTPHEVRHFNSGLVKLNFGDPLAAAELRSQVDSADLLANPRIRVRNKQSAKILIGQRVPVITTTATANVGSSESVNYLDVGLKLDIEPAVSLDDDVSMKVALEVSSIIQTITTPNGTQAYQLGTRNTATSLRVHDGETSVLAGLIQRDQTHSNTGIPGFNEIPLLAKLFGAAQDRDDRTEIVLLITPHIIRNIELPGVGLQEFTAGTDSDIGARPIQLGTPQAPGSRPTGVFQPFIPHAPPNGGAPALPGARTLPSGLPGAASGTPIPSGDSQAFSPPPLVPTSPGSDRSGSSNHTQPQGQ